MREVAIIGAGEIGGAAAHVLAKRGVARSIRIVDTAGSIAEGKALDIAQAAPLEGFATRLSGSNDVATAAGAEVIVFADAVNAELTGEEAAQFIARLVRMAPRAIIVCAAPQHRDAIDRAVRELGLDRRRLIGSAPEAFVSGARALCALALNGSPREVSLSVVGNPPAQTVALWESASYGGVAVTALLDEPARRRLAARIAASWPPAAYALACAAAAAIESIAGRSRRTVTCFVGPDTTAGTRTRTTALPVRLGPSGVVDVMMPAMSAAERIALEGALTL